MRRGSDHDVAELLGISVDRLQKRIQAGEAAPPYIRVPGSRSRVWDMDDVDAWLQKFRCATPLPTSTAPHIAQPKRSRGRPPKSESRRYSS